MHDRELEKPCRQQWLLLSMMEIKNESTKILICRSGEVPVGGSGRQQVIGNPQFLETYDLEWTRKAGRLSNNLK